MAQDTILHCDSTGGEQGIAAATIAVQQEERLCSQGTPLSRLRLVRRCHNTLLACSDVRGALARLSPLRRAALRSWQGAPVQRVNVETAGASPT